MKRIYSLEDFGVKKHETTLSNGLRVIFIEKPFAPIYAKIEMGAGSVCNQSDNGLAHFTEHMLMNGSKNMSKEKFCLLMESIGGYKNAFTSRDWMSVNAEVAEASHLPKMKNYFAEAIESIYCTEDMLQKEKEIIFSELQKARTSSKYEQGIKVRSFFTNGGPYSHSNLGTADQMNALTTRDVEEFFSTYCVAENSALIVAGGCTMPDIEKTFSGLRMLHGKKSALPKSPAMIPPCQRHFLQKDQPETEVIISFNGPKAHSRESYVLNFAMSFAQRGQGSLFYQNIRTKGGLSYSVEEVSLGFNETKYFGTSVGTPPRKANEAIETLLKTYKTFLAKGMSQKSIDKKSAAMYFSAKRNNERAADWVGNFAYAVHRQDNPVIGDFPDIHNFRQTITSEEVREVLQKYIKMDEFHLCVAGKEPSKKYF